MYQCLNGAIPSRKCSIKAPAKWRHSVYVLMDICLQWSKWLGPLAEETVKPGFWVHAVPWEMGLRQVENKEKPSATLKRTNNKYY